MEVFFKGPVDKFFLQEDFINVFNFLRETLSRAPFGAKPRLFSRGFLCKTFFIWFLTSNKFVLEIKLAEKESLSLNTMSLYKGLNKGFLNVLYKNIF